MAERQFQFITIFLCCILIKQSNACGPWSFSYPSYLHSYSYSYSYSYSWWYWYWSSESHSYYNSEDVDMGGAASQMYETDTSLERNYCNGTLDFTRVNFEERSMQSTEGNEFCELRIVTHNGLRVELELLHVEESVSTYLFVESLKPSARQIQYDKFATLDVDSNPYPQHVLLHQSEVVLHVRATAAFKIREIQEEDESASCQDGGQDEISPGIRPLKYVIMKPILVPIPEYVNGIMTSYVIKARNLM